MNSQGPSRPRPTEARPRATRLGALVLLLAASAAAPGEDRARPLAAGDAVEATLSRTEVHRYRVTLESGSYLQLAAEEESIDLQLDLFGPGGTRIVRVDTPGNILDPERIALVGGPPGEYRLEARASLSDTSPGSYRLRIEELRPATEADAARAAAWTALREAETLRAQQTSAGARASLARYEEAIAAFRRIGDGVGERSAIFGSARARDGLGERQAALELFGRALDSMRQASDRRSEAVVLTEIGLIHYGLGNLAKAMEAYNEALPLHRAAKNRRREAVTLNNIGLVLVSSGNVDRGLDSYRQSLALNRQTNHRRGEAINLINLGAAHDTLGEKPTAIEYYRKALPLYEALGDRTRAANVWNNLGAVHASLGEFQRALDMYYKALEAWQAAGDQGGEAATLHNLAHVYSNMGRPERAIEPYERALAKLRAVGNRAGEATTLNNLARVYDRMRDFSKALDHFRQALPILRAVNNRAVEAHTLTNIGAAYFALGDRTTALDYYQKALSLHREVKSRSGEAYALHALAAFHLSSGDAVRAGELYRQAIGLYQAVGDRRAESMAHHGLARVECTRGNLAEARNRIETALRIVESLRASVVSQQLRASYLARVQNLYELHVAILMEISRNQPDSGLEAAAFEASERSRARSLLETLAEGGIDVRAGADGALIERERVLDQRINTTAQRRTQLQGRPGTEEQIRALNKDLASLSAEYDDVQARIRAGSPRYAALLRPEPLTAREIQSQVLDADTLLVEYALGEERSFVWLVSPDALESFELPKRAVVEAAARRYLEAAHSGGDGWLDPTLQLSRMVLSPFADRLRAKRLVIVADGALQYVPFASLAHPRADGYRALVVDHEIVHLPSASTLAVSRRETADRRPAPKAVAVIADPVFRSDDGRVRAAGRPRPRSTPPPPVIPSFDAPQRGEEKETTFGRLLGTRREAEAILQAAPAGSSKRALDFEARRELVASGELVAYRAVHFATHGVLDTMHPELSGIVLSLVDADGEPRDGILRLHEIYNLRLPVELVVLSACQTALGTEIRGEGVTGLTRGFMYAGASRVVASLWKVDDRATATLMKNFYRAMLGPDRLPAAAALRAAQLAVSREKQWQSPYFWAAFVLQGEWR